jgi:hypothetical protein
VVKARILPKGFIERNTAKGVKKDRPLVGRHERLYEIEILEVFKGALGRQLEVNTGPKKSN